MKKTLTLFLAAAMYISSSFGQCIPDSANLSPNQLLYPAMVPCILPSVPYNSVLSILVPDSLPGSDFNNPLARFFTIIIDSININSISGYPSGITSSSTPALGSWIPVGGYACAAFSGTTNAPIGNYPLTVSGIGCGHFTIPIIGRVDTCMPYNFSTIYPYDLQVCDTLCSNILDTTYATLCRGDSIQWGVFNVKRAGRYIDTLLQSTGCDSLKILFVTVVNPAASRDSVINCRSVAFSGATYTVDTTINIVYPGAAANGCDSTVRYIIVVGGTVTPAISVSNNALLATDARAVSYQWLQNGSPIASATAATYAPTGGVVNNYQVIATDAFGCADTSAVFSASGITELQTAAIRLYPNPNNGTFIMQTRNSKGAAYIITNEAGQVMEQNIISTDKQSINLGTVATGVYTISVKGLESVSFTVTK